MNNKILVIGDSCIDIFIYGKSIRLCPDAPVPVFIPESEVHNGGMASNVYENILSIYDNVDIITNEHKITKTRYVESRNNHMLLRVDSEKSKLDRIENIKDINFSKYTLIVISDYNKGFLEKEDIEYICKQNKNVFIDTKKILGEFCINAKFIKINDTEYRMNSEVVNLDFIEHKIIRTIASRGCIYNNKVFPVENINIKDTSGAGDSFISALVVEYLKSKNINKAIKFANKCATLVVQEKGVNKIGDLL